MRETGPDRSVAGMEDVHFSAPAPSGFVFPPPRRGKRRIRLRHSDFHTTWRSEIALLNSTAKKVAALVGAVIAVSLPFVLSASLVRLTVLGLVASVAAVSLNMISGVAGQLSLGHAAFVGVGAYTAAYVTTDLGLHFLVSFPLAAALAGLLGLVVAPMALRLRGLYLAVVTLGVVFAMQHLFRNWDSVTGGVNGKRVQSPSLFGIDLVRGGDLGPLHFGQNQAYYFLALVVLVLVVLTTKNLLRSRIGRSFGAVRDHDIAAGVVGVGVFAAKTRAYVISSAMAGIAGVLLAGFLRFVTFEQWDLLLSVEYLAMIVLGGLGSLAGSVMGAFFITAIPEIVDRLSGVLPFVSSEPGAALNPGRAGGIIAGALVVVVMVAEPAGLNGLYVKLRTYAATWPFRR